MQRINCQSRNCSRGTAVQLCRAEVTAKVIIAVKEVLLKRY
jgi:hypothetical protein